MQDYQFPAMGIERVTCSYDSDWYSLYGLELLYRDGKVLRMGEFEDWLSVKHFEIPEGLSWIGVKSKPHPQISEAYRINFCLVFANMNNIHQLNYK